MKMLVAFLSLRVWEGAFFGCFYFATFLAQALIHLPYFCLTGSDAQDHTPSQTFGCLREVALGGGREEFSPSPPVNRTHLRLLSNGAEWGRVPESCVGRKDFLLFFLFQAPVREEGTSTEERKKKLPATEALPGLTHAPRTTSRAPNNTGSRAS